ncbi:MAG: hypothetical protein AB7K68_01845 [Bacteriovoracia bacterium]
MYTLLAILTLAFTTPAALAAEASCGERFAALSRFERKSDLRENLTAAKVAAGLMTYPYRSLAKAGTIRVMGKIGSGKAAAEEALANLVAYDHAMGQLGFRTPASTRLVMAENSYHSSIGPFSVSAPILNIRDFRLPENTIAMNPFLTNRLAATSKSVLLHERTHGILHATYDKKAFINKDNTIQEALADFMAAMNLDDPAMGMGALHPDLPIRDIATGVSGGGKWVVSPENFGGRYHDNSMLFSRTLWRLKEAIGKEKMQALIKPIIDDLNLHHASAVKRLGLNEVGTDTWNYGYFLSSLRKTLIDKGERKGADFIEKESAVHGMKTEMFRIEGVNGLSRAGDFSYKKGEKIWQGLVVHAEGAAVVGAAAAPVGAAGYGIVYAREQDKKFREQRKSENQRVIRYDD